MIKSIIKKLLAPIRSQRALWKYGGIWGLKAHLAGREEPDKKLLEIYNAYFSIFGSYIGYSAHFAGIPCFPHGYYGIFISGESRIGKNAVIFQHAQIGRNTFKDHEKAGVPVLGDNVYVGMGAKIIGKVVIGDNCRIGANAVVYQDLPPNSVAVPSPTRIIQKDSLDNRFFTRRGGKYVYYDDGEWIQDPERTGD